MKKYLAIFAVLFTVILSSCTNDDIPVAQTTTFKINPNTVISGFKEVNPGDLTVIDSRYQLRIRVLVYNEAGKLVAEDEQKFSDYAHIMTSNIDLSLGEDYKAIAISDICRKSDGFQYWKLTDKEDLSTIRISNTGYMGSENNILGISTTDVRVEQTSQVNIDLKPAGSLMIAYYKGIRSWSDVSEYQLDINRCADYVTFDSWAKPEWNVKASSEYDWRISKISVSDYDDSPNVKSIYEYVFTLPYGQTNMRFIAKIESTSKWVQLTKSISLNLRQGSEFLITCDIANKEIEYEQWAAGRSSADIDAILSMPGDSERASSFMTADLKETL